MNLKSETVLNTCDLGKVVVVTIKGYDELLRPGDFEFEYLIFFRDIQIINHTISDKKCICVHCRKVNRHTEIYKVFVMFLPTKE